MELAGPLGTPLGLAQWKRASSRGETGNLGFPHPWDSPGKNTGVGCHFLLRCMKVKSERALHTCLSAGPSGFPVGLGLPSEKPQGGRRHLLGTPGVLLVDRSSANLRDVRIFLLDRSMCVFY